MRRPLILHLMAFFAKAGPSLSSAFLFGSTLVTTRRAGAGMSSRAFASAARPAAALPLKQFGEDDGNGGPGMCSSRRTAPLTTW